VLVLGVLASLLTRAARWQAYFLPDRRVPFRPLLETLAISYMASTFLPLRAGELVRAVFLGQRESLPVARVVGTILLEKLFDFLAIGIMLGALVGATVLSLSAPLPREALAAGAFASIAILGGFAFVVALALWREPTLAVVAWVQRLLPLGLGHRLRLERSVRHFAEGTDSLRIPRLWVPLLGWTVATWLLSIVATWGGVASLGVQPTLAAVLFVIVLTSTGQAVPSSPGYVGVYHAAAALALQAFGIPAPTAIAIALVTHAFSYGSLVIAGLVALWTGGYTFGDVLLGGGSLRSQRSPTPP
jgi:uncharacterized protein (TIRG00374 family)